MLKGCCLLGYLQESGDSGQSKHIRESRVLEERGCLRLVQGSREAPLIVAVHEAPEGQSVASPGEQIESQPEEQERGPRSPWTLEILLCCSKSKELELTLNSLNLQLILRDLGIRSPTRGLIFVQQVLLQFWTLSPEQLWGLGG